MNTGMNEKNNATNRTANRSQLVSVWMRYRRNTRAMAGLILLLGIVLTAVVGGAIIDYDAQAVKQNMAERLQAPGSEHILGTDHYGRDMAARIIHGAGISLSMSVGVIVSAFGIGLIIGAASGYFGGRIDNAIMRVMDIFIAIPYTLFAICIAAALGPGFINLLIAMTVALAPRFSKVVRAATLPLKTQEYIEAARACGTSHLRIIIKHIIPNAAGPILVHVTLEIANTIKAVAGLSFIGLGIQPPAPEWGAMLSEGKEFMRQFPHLVIIPGAAIILAAMSFNLIGDGLRDALDPRLKN
jgi:peptide/nickel transport system permease protein